MSRCSLMIAALWLLSLPNLGSAAGDLSVINNAAAGEALQKALDVLISQMSNVIPQPWVHAGVASRGNWRLRRLLMKAAAGSPIHVGVAGGSVSCYPAGYPQLVHKRLRSMFPLSNITLRNGCTAGTTSALTAACTNHFVDDHADLVFIEYNNNEGIHMERVSSSAVKAVERLTRRLMDLERRPAVSFVSSLRRGQNFWGQNEELDQTKRHFHETGDDVYTMVAQYYGASSLSMRNSMWHLYSQRPDSGYNYTQIFKSGDWTHPHKLGQQILADIVMALIQQTIGDLLTRPYSAAEEYEYQQPLSYPMYPDNYAPNSAVCVLGEEIESKVLVRDGWQLAAHGSEHHKKWGLVTDQIGRKLSFKVYTGNNSAKDSARVYVAFLADKEKMGRARVACISGCKCRERVVDAHIPDLKAMEGRLTHVDVTPHEACVIEVTTLQDSSSGQHTFKVSGYFVSPWRAEVINGPTFDKI